MLRYPSRKLGLSAPVFVLVYPPFPNAMVLKLGKSRHGGNSKNNGSEKVKYYHYRSQKSSSSIKEKVQKSRLAAARALG
ncbi:hypothetical protein BDW66DRAFT_87527 [Aspergillus desertorum]